MFEALKGFEDVAEFVKALKEYLSLKSRVLWENTSGVGKGTTITCPNLSKYQIAEMSGSYGSFFFNPQDSRLRGIHSDKAADTDANAIPLIYGTITGDKIFLDKVSYTMHNLSGSHSAAVQSRVFRVTGIEPVIPEALKKYLGGGSTTT